MIQRELKVNFKSFIIWLSVLIVIFLVVYLIYPYIINDGAISKMDEMMEMFPEGMLKAFNMDIISMSTAYGWLKTEGFTFILLIIGMYSSYLGGTILLKEESDKTIEYLGSLPIKRSSIVTSKVLVGLFYIIMMVALLGLFNYIALTLSGDLNTKEFILLSIIPLLVALPLFSLSLFISTFMHKTKKIIGLSIGMVFIFYVISTLSEISEKVEKLKYFSLYTLADFRNVIANCAINKYMLIISLIITITLIALSYLRYNKKELI